MEYCGRRHEKAELTMSMGARIKGKPVRLGKLPGEWKLEGGSSSAGGQEGVGQGLGSGEGKVFQVGGVTEVTALCRGPGKEQS